VDAQVERFEDFTNAAGRSVGKCTLRARMPAEWWIDRCCESGERGRKGLHGVPSLSPSQLPLSLPLPLPSTADTVDLPSFSSSVRALGEGLKASKLSKDVRVLLDHLGAYCTV
jgi:hypothetical protein